MLAQAISRAHILGINRQRTVENLPMFESEICKRTWWCVFVLDRRITLESGRPHLIHEHNIDVEDPLNLSAEFLEAYCQDPRTAAQLRGEIRAELDCHPATPVDYLIATASFSRIAGDVWKVLYVPKPPSWSSLEVMDSCLELQIKKAEGGLPPYLVHKEGVPFEEQYRNMKWWQIKQSLLLYIVSVAQTS